MRILALASVILVACSHAASNSDAGFVCGRLASQPPPQLSNFLPDGSYTCTPSAPCPFDHCELTLRPCSASDIGTINDFLDCVYATPCLGILSACDSNFDLSQSCEVSITDEPATTACF
jgi:hypothetical protein